MARARAAAPRAPRARREGRPAGAFTRPAARAASMALTVRGRGAAELYALYRALRDWSDLALGVARPPRGVALDAPPQATARAGLRAAFAHVLCCARA